MSTAALARRVAALEADNNQPYELVWRSPEDERPVLPHQRVVRWQTAQESLQGKPEAPRPDQAQQADPK